MRAACTRTTTSAMAPSRRTACASKCYSPSATWTETEHNSHQSHEIRLGTPDDWRFRGIVGAFWEQLKIEDQLNWQYKTLPPCTDPVTAGCLTNVGPAPGSTRPIPDAQRQCPFFNDVHRGYKQTAFFASLDFDLVPKVLTLTAGTRYYDFDNTETGAVTGSFYCYEAGPAPRLNYATNLDAENLHTQYKGFKSRANLTWHVRRMRWSTTRGRRVPAGAFNRNSACYIQDSQESRCTVPRWR